MLCVGDSFTFGDGASSPEHSYPAILGDLLRQRYGLEATVVNAGWPGRDSREVLSTLPNRIRECSPQVVCVLVGANDKWNRPAPLEALEASGTSADGFQFCWRTGRLLRLMTRSWGALHDVEPEKAAIPNEPAAPPTAAMVESAAVLVREGGVVLGRQQPEWPDSGTPETRAAIRTAWAAMDRGEFGHAIATMEAALAKDDDASEARRLLVCASGRAGDHARAARELETMQQRQLAEPTHGRTAWLAQALWDAGKMDASYELAGDGVTKWPRCPVLWEALSTAALRHSEEEAARALQQRLELEASLSPALATAVASLGRCIAKDEPARAARLLSAALLLKGDLQGHPLACYMIGAQNIQSATMREVLQAAALDARGQALLQQAFDEVYGSASGLWLATLRLHLTRIHALATANGAQVVYLAYPFLSEQEPSIRAAAQGVDAPFVAVCERFARELQSHRREELFVADGHCNDAGYAILADEVARVVAPLLKR